MSKWVIELVNNDVDVFMKNLRAKIIIFLTICILSLLYSCTFVLSDQDSKRGVSLELQRFHPLSKDQWGLNEIPPCLLRVVVISTPNPDKQGKFIFGNGVLVHSSKENGTLVLSCAHLVPRKGQQQGDIHIGLFRHSYQASSCSVPEYEEFVAQEIARDDNLDLALVKFSPPNLVHTSRLLTNAQNWAGAIGEKISIVSIIPYGSPSLEKRMIIHLREFREGQSGSGLFLYNDLVGLAQGTLGHRNGISVQSEDIVLWLDKIGMRNKVEVIDGDILKAIEDAIKKKKN